MPNDAKLGLVVGVGLVVAVAFIFFRKDPAALTYAPIRAPEVAVAAPKSEASTGERGAFRQTPALPATRTETTTTGMRHTVQEGETLQTLAQRYYGDKEKSGEILKVNRELVTDADNLTPGTVLTIPELSAKNDSATENGGSN